MDLARRIGPVLIAILLLVVTILASIDPWPLFVCPSIIALATAALGLTKAFKFFVAFTVGLMVKETQLEGFAYALNMLGAAGAFCLSDWHKTHDVQIGVPILVGAALHCRVSEACPDSSVQDYAEAQRYLLLSLVGLGTITIVMRVFDKAAVAEDACGILLRGLALASAGVHIFLESAICQSEEGEIVRGMYGMMTTVALM